MLADAQFHKLSLVMFDFSMCNRTIVNFRPGEKPDNFVAAMMVYVLFEYYFELGGLSSTGSSFRFVLALFAITHFRETGTLLRRVISKTPNVSVLIKKCQTTVYRWILRQFTVH